MRFLFHVLFSVKITVEIRFNNVLDRKQTFLTIKTKFFKVPKIVFFRGVNPCFWSKNAIFLFVFGQNKTRNNAK